MFNTLLSKPVISTAAFGIMGAAIGLAAMASAQTATTATTPAATATTHPMGMHHEWGGERHGAMGTVTRVNGTTITVTGKDGTTYTVDASSATVSKMVDLTVSDIKVGDTVGVMGDVSGSSVTAKHIMDGMPPKPNTQ